MALKPWDLMTPTEQVVHFLCTYLISSVGQTLTALINNPGLTFEKRIEEVFRTLAVRFEETRKEMPNRWPEIWNWSPSPVGLEPAPARETISDATAAKASWDVIYKSLEEKIDKALTEIGRMADLIEKALAKKKQG